MGTRADFYIGIGPAAEWLGSVTYDGHPEYNGKGPLAADSEEAFRLAVATLLDDPKILSTSPSEGWPWPWEDSRTTDYAYAWTADRGAVLSVFGRPWVTLSELSARGDAYYEDEVKLRDDEVVDMRSRKMDRDGVLAKSGLIILAGQRERR